MERGDAVVYYYLYLSELFRAENLKWFFSFTGSFPPVLFDYQSFRGSDHVPISHSSKAKLLKPDSNGKVIIADSTKRICPKIHLILESQMLC